MPIGWAELLVIAIIALVVVGPKDLPRLVRMVGKAIAHLRTMGRELQASFDELSREAELDELRREVNALRAGTPVSVERGPKATAKPTPADTPETEPGP